MIRFSENVQCSQCIPYHSLTLILQSKFQEGFLFPPDCTSRIITEILIAYTIYVKFCNFEFSESFIT
ncbi:hypothetical protein JTB14_028133 [Gonioctena quinquepunctata]|nr:hypothetical protein JTB14_028133 [Gonioctena quinquepunctata]